MTKEEMSLVRKEVNDNIRANYGELAKFLSDSSEFCPENVEIVNKERQIAFRINEDAFELTLVQKRKPKN